MAERWRRIDAVFTAALSLSGPARRQFLRRECGSDPELLAEVESLLDTHDRSDDFLEEPAFAVTEGEDDGDGEAAIGSVVGGFRIVRRIAVGGMGVVYEAEQRDPRRRVALKVLRGGRLLDDKYRRWFRREVAVLARLTHAGIAAIHDAGQTGDGVPFFAMELVRGEPLTEFAARRQLTVGERLELFEQVCDAVEHAHRAGVVHRDLKPSNILVAGERDGASARPVVKVLDFGLAHVMEGIANEPVSRVTLSGQVVGTVDYMSPEQARGDTVDAASDVYSLGVVLHELLTGQRPIEVSSLAVHDAVRAIVEDRPRRLGEVDRKLRGDLETIVGKALQKEPERRYPTVRAFAADLGRFRRRMPIAAKPPSVLYQLRKMVGRNRLLAGSLALLFAVLLGTSIALTMLYAGQRDAERRARDEAAVAKEINRLLQETLYGAVAPQVAGAREVTVRQLLEQTARRLETQPPRLDRVAVAMHRTIGNAFLSLGRYDEARHHLERAWAHRNPDAETAADTAVDLGELYRERGDYAAARDWFERAVALWEKLDPNGRGGLERAVVGLAGAHRFLGEAKAAEALYRRGLALGAAGDQTRLATIESNLAGLLATRNRFDEAQRLYDSALRRFEREHGEHHVQVAMVLNNQASMAIRRRHCAEAVLLLERSCAIQERILDADHPSLATAHHNLGQVLIALDRLDRAEAMLRRALEVRERVLPPQHPHLASTRRALRLIEEKRR